MTRDLRVCFIGDSYVAGTGDPEYLGWVGRIAVRSHRNGLPLTAYSLGVRRQTSRDVLARWKTECGPRLPDTCECRVVMSFGVNDTTVEAGAQRVPVVESAANLSMLLDGVASAAWRALVVGPPPIADQAQNQRIALLDEAFSSVCADAGAEYVSVFDQLLVDRVWMRQVARNDGAHPAAEGYRHMADLIWDRWQAWVGPARPLTSAQPS